MGGGYGGEARGKPSSTLRALRSFELLLLLVPLLVAILGIAVLGVAILCVAILCVAVLLVLQPRLRQAWTLQTCRGGPPQQGAEARRMNKFVSLTSFELTTLNRELSPTVSSASLKPHGNFEAVAPAASR